MSDLATDGDLDYSKMKVADLKQELKKRGLNTDGKKSDLIERLQLSSGDTADLDDTHDDLLDEDVLSDEEVLNDTVIDTLPLDTSLTPGKRAMEGDDVKRHPKKIILNRKVVTEPEPEPEPSEQVTEPSVGTDVATASVIKVTALSQKEKLEKRAARFGGVALVTATPAAATVVSPTDATKESRAIQFGATATASVSKTPNLDLLKKRAERFGTVAPVLEKVELEERKKKRLERFGSSEGERVLVSTTTTIKASNGNQGDKKVQRAQRFAVTS